MKYYKIIDSGCILAIGTGSGGDEITSEEYYFLMSVIRSRPTPPEGYDYRLKTDLTWELYELPPMPPIEEEPTPQDYETALERFGVNSEESA